MQLGTGHAMQSTTNRKGRKRKAGRREGAGRLQRAPVDLRALVALQPGRRDLPEAYRTHERAESYLGRLNLEYRIHESRKANAGHSTKVLKPGITDEQYEAGRRYSVLVGAYRAMVGAPRGTAGSGHGGHECVTGACETCRRTTDRYMRAHEAIGQRCQGVPRIARQTHAAVNWVVIDDRICNADQLMWLKRGLDALAEHFGLTNHRKY
jgi:hypothetical protein